MSSSTDYNVIIELDTRDDVDEQLLDAFAPYHPATGRGSTGRVQLVITVPAVDFVQVMQTTAALLARHLDAPILTVEYMTTRDFDRRLDATPIPKLVSVKQAADALGVSRQAVQQRIDAGTLPAEKVGSTWVVPASAVESAIEGALRMGRAIEAESWDVAR